MAFYNESGCTWSISTCLPISACEQAQNAASCHLFISGVDYCSFNESTSFCTGIATSVSSQAFSCSWTDGATSCNPINTSVCEKWWGPLNDTCCLAGAESCPQTDPACVLEKYLTGNICKTAASVSCTLDTQTYMCCDSGNSCTTDSPACQKTVAAGTCN